MPTPGSLDRPCGCWVGRHRPHRPSHPHGSGAQIAQGWTGSPRLLGGTGSPKSCLLFLHSHLSQIHAVQGVEANVLASNTSSFEISIKPCHIWYSLSTSENEIITYKPNTNPAEKGRDKMKGNQDHTPSLGAPPWALTSRVCPSGLGVSCSAAAALLGDDANDTF